jgi:rhodanese-related sulfurtransferase
MRELQPAELKPLLDAGGVMLLDVRGPEEVALAALPGAVHIPMPEIAARLSELDPTAPIVVLCHHGVRSEMAGRLLERNGFTAVSHLAGGIDAWSRQVDAGVPRY